MYPKKPTAETGNSKPKPKQLTVSVLGRHMKIACPAGQEEKLQNAMLELEERVSKTKYQPGVHGAEDVLLMIALNLCNELLELKKNAD
ncbi:cell division protein ZapA [Rheinheimera sp.]|uniref:cell division protein ZapA n=1 Tax=Rheinheimera sp. TaxID=1869214 RepID=UPI0027B903E7|nr:cell division protein ZapA [Rheinheimera sp.]